MNRQLETRCALRITCQVCSTLQMKGSTKLYTVDGSAKLVNCG